MNDLIVKYKVATCHYTELCHVIAYSPIITIISDLQITTSERAISIRCKLIMNIISMTKISGYLRCVEHFAAF